MLKSDNLKVAKDDLVESPRVGVQGGSDEFHRSLLEASPEPLIVYDATGHPFYLNPAFSNLFGWTLEDLVNDETRFVPAEQALIDRAMIDRLLNGQKSLRFDSLRITKDGRELNVSVNGAPFSFGKSPVAGCILYLRDNSTRRRLDQAMLRRQKLESVGLLAGGIAHDFNNALSGILMNAQMAQIAYRKQKDITRYLLEIEETTMATAALTKQLLTFAKGGTPVLQTMSIVALIEESAATEIEGSLCACELTIDQDLWEVRVDRAQLCQVIHNLVRNAVQAMPQGGRVEICAENVTLEPNRRQLELNELNSGDYVRISVRDEGVGIPSDHLSKVFDPYFTTKLDGSGLGLAAAFSIMKKHGGSITVSSIPDAGTLFSAYLPANVGCETPIALRYTPPSTPTTVPAGKESGRILFMDDEQGLRQVAEEMLQSLGYDFTPAADGEEAVKLYKQALARGRRFDAVIMDLTVPGGMGGQQAVLQLREIDPQIKAIVSSGYSNDPVMSEYRSQGFCGVLAKPYRLGELGRVLRRVLGK